MYHDLPYELECMSVSMGTIMIINSQKDEYLSKMKIKQNFQKSMHQMSYMNQQMQQAGQRMQGQNHIKGAEIDESDE